MRILCVIAGLIATAAAWADEDVDAVRMLPNRMFLPSFAAELGLEGTLDPDQPLLTRAILAVRGVPMRRSGWSWMAASASATFGPLATDGGLDPVAFDARVAVQRRATESNPVVAASDARLGCLELSRDRTLGVDLDGSFEAARWSGGMYLPALFPHDIDARVVVGVQGIGVRWRRFSAEGPSQPPDFWGFTIGGLSGELVYGRKLGPGVTLTGHGGGQVDWSVGSAGHGVTLLTDTEIWLGGALDLGDHHELQLRLGRDVAHRPPQATAAAALTLTWRTTW